jgi:Ca-activated chloride channel homolog
MINLTFDQPIVLWLFFSIPLLVFTHLYFMHHAKQQAILFGNFKTLERVTGKKLLSKNLLQLLIRCVIIICLILAGAGTTIWKESKNSTNDVVILIDTSASMTTPDMNGTRIDSAKLAAIDFVNHLNRTARVGVVQFSGLAEVVLVPTVDKDEVVNAIQSVQLRTIGGTDIAGAIITAGNLLATSQSGKVVLLMTDGVSSISLYDENPIPRAIEYAQKHHVVIHTIGIGNQSDTIGSYIPELTAQAQSYDEQNLQEIANATGGSYSWAQNPEQLSQAYQAIIQDGNSGVEPIQLSFGFLFAALTLLFIEWGLMNTRYRLLP